MELLMNTKDAAARLHVSTETIRRWQREGRIAPAQTTPGGHARWSCEQIDEISEVIAQVGTPPLPVEQPQTYDDLEESFRKSVRARFQRSHPLVEPQPQLQGVPALDELNLLLSSDRVPVIAVASPRGGTGVTLAAIDIAALAAAQGPDVRVLLIEVCAADGVITGRYRLTRPHQARHFHRWSWGEGSGPLDVGGLPALSMLIDDVAVEHAMGFATPLEFAPNVHVIAGDQPWFNAMDEDEIASAVARIIDRIGGQFDLVVIDCDFDSIAMGKVLKSADLVLMPTSADPAHLHYTRKVLQRLSAQHNVDNVRVLVLDDPRSDLDALLVAQDVLKDVAIHAVMNRTRLADAARAKGVPLATDARRAREIAATLSPPPFGHVVKEAVHLQPQMMPLEEPQHVQEPKHAGFFALLKKLAS